MKSYPSHPWIPSALKAARGLADNYFPVTPHQLEAQTRIYAAVERGNLYEVIEALRQARMPGTDQWRRWHESWLYLVQTRVLDMAEADFRLAA